MLRLGLFLILLFCVIFCSGLSVAGDGKMIELQAEKGIVLISETPIVVELPGFYHFVAFGYQELPNITLQDKTGAIHAAKFLDYNFEEDSKMIGLLENPGFEISAIWINDEKLSVE